MRVSISLDPDQDRHTVCPDLGPNCLQRLSVEDTSKKRVNLISVPISFKSRFVMNVILLNCNTNKQNLLIPLNLICHIIIFGKIFNSGYRTAVNSLKPPHGIFCIKRFVVSPFIIYK